MTKIAIAPQSSGDSKSAIRSDAIRRALSDNGYDLADVTEAQGLVWTALFDAEGLARELEQGTMLRWVQLPRTGIDNYLEVIRSNPNIEFTCAKGAFAPEVAEHALMLALAVMRCVPEQASKRSWKPVDATSLVNKRIAIVGGGYICERLIEFLAPFGCEITVVRRSAKSFPGAVRTVTNEALHEVLPTSDVVFLALSLTPQTHHIISTKELALMPKGSYLINVARGQHVDPEALVAALRDGQLAGAGLDVTDPEPLPESHPFWGLDNLLITSHSANSPDFVVRTLAERTLENVRRLEKGEPLVGLVDPEQGY